MPLEEITETLRVMRERLDDPIKTDGHDLPALWPVSLENGAANIAYGLSVQGRRDEDGIIARLLEVMGLTEHATRYPCMVGGV